LFLHSDEICPINEKYTKRNDVFAPHLSRDFFTAFFQNSSTIPADQFHPAVFPHTDLSGFPIPSQPSHFISQPAPPIFMTRLGPDGLRIIAQYLKKTGTGPENAGESLRVEGQGLIPRAGPNYCIQIAINDAPASHQFPAEFNNWKFLS
jgi:hypothetical protein